MLQPLITPRLTRALPERAPREPWPGGRASVLHGFARALAPLYLEWGRAAGFVIGFSIALWLLLPIVAPGSG